MKIAFIQNKGGNYGGVWQVNKMVGEALIKDGYEVSVISLREDHLGLHLEHDKRLKVVTINKKNLWHTYYRHDFIESLKKHHYLEFIKRVNSRIKNILILKKDIKKLNKYLDEYKPDYIITSHYQLLDMLDKKFLSKTFHEQHLSFQASWSHKATRNTLLKYNGKISYIWLCEKTKAEAEKNGLKNNYVLYNAVRFETEKTANVLENKKLATIARLSCEKRIDKMIDYVEEIFKEKKYHNWVLEIWGDGEERGSIKKMISSSQIKLMGSTDNPKKVLLNASINLNTSDYEGFALSILEAAECGVPTVTLNFGESVTEQIIDGKTGFIANNKKDYINKLKKLMDNQSLLTEMSTNAKEYNEKFRIEKIVKEWEKLFK